ncbi:hypothetical protein AAY473_014451, partial [Plecturocebus cupreus]
MTVPTAALQFRLAVLDPLLNEKCHSPGLTLSPRLKCSGSIIAHYYSVNLLSSQVILPPQPSQQLKLQACATIPVEKRSCHVALGGLELLGSSDSPTSASQSPGITGLSHCAWPCSLFLNKEIVMISPCRAVCHWFEICFGCSVVDQISGPEGNPPLLKPEQSPDPVSNLVAGFTGEGGRVMQGNPAASGPPSLQQMWHTRLPVPDPCPVTLSSLGEKAKGDEQRANRSHSFFILTRKGKMKHKQEDQKKKLDNQ